MRDFFAMLYEWFGIVPVYSKDLGEFLRGLDLACTGYWALPWYFYTGVMMIILTVLLFGLQYDLIDSRRFQKQRHWALAAVLVIIVNFFIAFTIPFVALQTGVYCPRLKLSVLDCIGFGLSNAVWSFILFSLLSGVQEILWLNKNRKPAS
jgi:hypothetical protein